jgi:hypothetical protein
MSAAPSLRRLRLAIFPPEAEATPAPRPAELVPRWGVFRGPFFLGFVTGSKSIVEADRAARYRWRHFSELREFAPVARTA